MRLWITLLVFLLICAAHSAPAQAKSLKDTVSEHVKNAEQKNYISVSIENDLIGGGTDKYYTNGLRLTYFNAGTEVPPYIDKLADEIPTFDLNETTSTFFTLGQNIYTPADITIAAPQPDDRPWAGFLYGSVGLVTLQENHLDELEVTLGVVGPESLGEQVQKEVHEHLENADDPKGWDNQLDFEPGLILSWGRRWPYGLNGNWMQEMGGYRMRAEPHVNVTLGNVYSYIGSGINVTIGPDYKAIQDTPPRVRPAMPGSGYFETPAQGWGWYLFGGLNGRLIGRNIFLDGNSFSGGPSVDKHYLVGDANLGAALTWGDYRLSYAINARSKEFYGQDEAAVFGSLTLSTRF